MEGNNNEDKKEVKPSCCTRFRTSMHNAGRFIYNPDTKEVLGRGGLSWLKIALFYLGFYCVLAGFWAACMVGFIRTLDPMAPTMQKMFSMMKDNPGMNYEPFFTVSSAPSPTLINVNMTNSSTYSDIVTRLTERYREYEAVWNTSTDEERSNCKADLDKRCPFNITLLEDQCTPNNSFGYEDGKPCVFLRINKVFLWEPNGVTFDDPNKCVGLTTPECKKQNEFLLVRDAVKSDIVPGYISVSCDGENDGDRDNIKGVQFYPRGGFPASFYPYYNQPGFKSPPVMAQFDLIKGRVSLILCKVWTRDIIHDQVDLQGSIHFELIVDK